jgi:hypothetical protein
LIFQHGETLEDIWQAHELARRAAVMGATKWLKDVEHRYRIDPRFTSICERSVLVKIDSVMMV